MPKIKLEFSIDVHTPASLELDRVQTLVDSIDCLSLLLDHLSCLLWRECFMRVVANF
jgi:hypothetical protein